MNIEKILEGLNESQRLAVEAPQQPVLVVAGPGTGKTLIIVRRIAYLITKGISPDEIVAITFTNRAASELKDRIKAFHGDLNGLFAGTFHLFGLRIIKEITQEAFSIINREEQVDLVKRLSGSERPSAIIEKISRIKNLLEEPDEKMKKIMEDYQELLQEKRTFDFDDLIIRAIELLGDPTYQEKYRRAIKYLIVDEYQDINPLQYRMLRTLSLSRIFVVGDPDQSIYSFRGANVKNFLDFEKDYPRAIKIVLDRNYRSQPFIVNASESLIRKNKERIQRSISSIIKEGSPVRVVSVPDDRAEIEFIVQEIEKRIGGMSHYSLMRGIQAVEGDYSFSDFAVLLRTNNQVLAMEAELKKAGIPCYVMGGALTESLREIIEYIEENKDKPLEILLQELSDRYRVLSSLLNNYIPTSLDDLINWLKLTGPEEDRLEAEGVRLLTMHMSKGLEFRVVFIAGLEEGLIPLESSEDIEEERRLLYVAMTRAKEELFLIQARRRLLYGKTKARKASPFLSEIEEEYIDDLFIHDRPRKEKQLGLF
ncbi:MAG: ATP-dependent helicase [Thermodesulfovibrionales bacterium]